MSSVPVIDATPTKELFIDMLTRDISLPASILDLIDNSVDGARRLRKEKSFDDLYVRIEFSKDGFSISDNCGGMPIEVAEKYAFRFGRPEGAEPTKHSIGRFGVGMKRAIFKLGRHFTVKSTTTDESFKTTVDVNKWSKTLDWFFPFVERKQGQKNKPEKIGTVVEVTDLLPDASANFERKTFASELAIEVKKHLSNPIDNGLLVTINSVPVTADPINLLSSPKLSPASASRRFKADGEAPVNVVLYCGLGPSEDVKAAGWHVYCNGRLILSGDKTAVTGWGANESGIVIPSFHGQFNLIRGYAFFDSDDVALLPWNTTKTGINPDSVTYRAVRLDMMRLMRPVIDFCNKLKEEKEASKVSEEEGALEKLLEASEVKAIDDIKARDVFKLPAVWVAPTPSGPPVQRLQYDRLQSKALAVKKALKAKSWKEVGEKTFDYYYNSEVGK